jgi:hypothetical protein
VRHSVLIVLMFCIAAAASAHNSYTGGYSGAPGTRTCASACHGGAAGTLAVTGFPATYQPGQTYRIVVKHNAGSPIVNFNATTRIGSTSSIAGTFTPTTNCTLYAGTDGGVYANPHSIDSAVFQWTAPARGTGTISFYAAAFQGTTSSSRGQSGSIVVTSTEIVITVQDHFFKSGRISAGTEFSQSFQSNDTNSVQPATGDDRQTCCVRCPRARGHNSGSGV